MRIQEGHPLNWENREIWNIITVQRYNTFLIPKTKYIYIYLKTFAYDSQMSLDICIDINEWWQISKCKLTNIMARRSHFDHAGDFWSMILSFETCWTHSTWPAVSKDKLSPKVFAVYFFMVSRCEFAFMEIIDSLLFTMAGLVRPSWRAA